MLKLTNETSRLTGHGFYPDPIRFKNPTTKKPISFSTSFVFAIIPEFKNPGGHGLAFTVSPAKEFVGAQPSQYLGILNVTNNENTSNHLFAVEFDTVLDLEFSDINDNHVGVNINAMSSKNSTKAGFFIDGNSTKQDLNLKSGRKIQAWVDYDALKPQLNVTLSLSSQKPNTPILSIPLNLEPVLQDFMYVGFSASTGLLASSHYIFGWSFNTSGKAQSFDLNNFPSIPRAKKNHKSLIIGVSVATLLALVIIAIGVVFVIKKTKNTDEIEEWELDVGPHRYSYKELKQATKEFREEEILGSVVCGRRPIEPKALPEELILVDFVWDKWTKGTVLEAVDKRLKGEFDEVEVLLVVKLGLMCSSNAPSGRPDMRWIVKYLEGEVPLPENVAPPCDGDDKGSFGIEFEDYVHSYPSSSV
ncbi:hypothetical protein L1887_09176 [Cichorium endivia]|nr:hypothetical protein L1887_09176 [Cichorium endivia]